jgi:hypothetical protein
MARSRRQTELPAIGTTTGKSLKIFISWSGDRSRQVAQALKEWLPDVIQTLDVWMSAHDIEAGTRWSSELTNRLDECAFGILCVTPENTASPWLLFEAGCLGKSVSTSRVIPYRLDLSATDIAFPLAQFQSVEADQAGTKKLLHAIIAAGHLPVDNERLNRLFEKWWPDLNSRLQAIAKNAHTKPIHRGDRELIVEILQLVRALNRGSVAGILSEYVLIDPRPFIGVTSEHFNIKYSEHVFVHSFLDSVYFYLKSVCDVQPYTYDVTWVLQDKASNKVYSQMGIGYARTVGKKEDDRPIASVGIRAGDYLCVLPASH